MIEFIIPTFDRINELRSELASLIAQDTPFWKALVIVDDETVIRNVNMASLISDFNDERIGFSFTGKRYNDWGHTPREIGKQLSNSKYVIMTGDDNYYTPNAVKEIILASETSPGLIYWDMVHSHYNYQYFKCNLAFNQIDMGAFATRTDLAKQIKLKTTYAADGEFVEEFKKRFPNEKIVKINKVLFVHN